MKLSIKQAAERGIKYLRKPVWAHPMDHLKIDIHNGTFGPWIRMYSPMNLDLNKRDPMDVLCIQMDCESEDFVEHTGPIADSPEYKTEQKKYEGVFGV